MVKAESTPSTHVPEINIVNLQKSKVNEHNEKVLPASGRVLEMIFRRILPQERFLIGLKRVSLLRSRMTPLRSTRVRSDLPCRLEAAYGRRESVTRSGEVLYLILRMTDKYIRIP
jgi:hypothetical protein